MNARFLSANDPNGALFAAFMAGKHVAHRRQAMFDAKLARISGSSSVCDFIKAARTENHHALYWLRQIGGRGAA